MAWQLSHVVDNSWLPLSIRIVAFLGIVNVLIWFKFRFRIKITRGFLLLVIFVFFLWIRDVGRERIYQGHHTFLVQRGLKWRLIWFLFREVWFFFSIFWTFFHVRVAPLRRGIWIWPNFGLISIPAFQVPLLNTVILLIRGVTATLAHQEILEGKKRAWVFIRRLLGLYFLRLQAIEYYYSFFSISSGIYGSVFFFGTGFHGLHVCLGIIMLLVRRRRVLLKSVSRFHHFGLEFSLWYWHFVDVVWLFLFFWVYAWGR
jgi:cytochrome c oxidase subunit 3